MKYENEEYERNFKSVLNQQLPNEASALTSTNSTNQSESFNNDIHVSRLFTLLLQQNTKKNAFSHV